MLCARCHTINPNGSLHCASCGEALSGVSYPASGAPTGPRRTSGLAIAGFILAFLWFLAILGLVFSIAGYREAKGSRGVIGGAGLAIAGMVIASLMILISLAGL
jgi:hypothetical protein